MQDMTRNVILLALLLALVAAILLLPQPAHPGAELENDPPSNATPGKNPENITQLKPFNVSGLASDGMKMGSDDSPVIMIEFSDFQCQYCRRFWLVNFAALKEEYIDTGKVQFVYRDLPLEIHNAAFDSALAAACAQEQGMGWEMHDKIFLVQANKTSGFVFYAKSDLKQWAREIGLDGEPFDQCLDSGKYADVVEASREDALSLGLDATPSFVIGLRNRSNYVTLQGALPYGTFKATIDELLSR